MERVELRDEELRILALCLRAFGQTRKLFHVLVMNVRRPALAVIRGIADVRGALAWRALIMRDTLQTQRHEYRVS